MLKIKEEFKRLIPELTPEEFKQLETNCMEEGIREKIITWNGYIIDGHNRYHIAQKWNLEYETESKYFDSEDDVKEWMITNQLGRRNLNEIQQSALIGKKLLQRKKTIGGQTGNTNAKNEVDNLTSSFKTAEVIAKEENKSARTVNRYGEFASGLEHTTAELETKILNKEVKVNKADVQLLAKAEPSFIALTERDIEEKAKEIKERKAEAYKQKLQERIEKKVEENPLSIEEQEMLQKIERGETVVINMNVHFHVLKYAKDKGIYKQIDRYSEFGNPFFLNSDGDRDQVCEGYIEYFKHKRSLHEKVKELKGKVLGCHCAPLRCHGDHLKQLADAD